MQGDLNVHSYLPYSKEQVFLLLNWFSGVAEFVLRSHAFTPLDKKLFNGAKQVSLLHCKRRKDESVNL